jgi:hypothetical protein
MWTKLLAATGVTACLLALTAVFAAQASIWCPTPIPGVLMKYCLCQPFTGSAEVWTRSRLPPLTLIRVWANLRQAANQDWASQVQAHQQPRKYLSTRLIYACDLDRWCTGTRKVVGSSVRPLRAAAVLNRGRPAVSEAGQGHTHGSSPA